MNVSQSDADLSAIMDINLDTLSGLDKLELALDTIGEITKYGITKSNYDDLKGLYPALTESELNLSSIPMRLGSANIGNEAASGIGAAAMVALFAILAKVIHWVITKVFGEGSSSGGGGGSLSSSVEVLDDAKIPCSNELFRQFLGDNKKYSDNKFRLVDNVFAAMSLMEKGHLESVLKVTDEMVALSSSLKSDDSADDVYSRARPLIATIKDLIDADPFVPKNGKIEIVSGLDAVKETYSPKAINKLAANMSTNSRDGSSAPKSATLDLRAVNNLEKDFKSVQKTLDANKKKVENASLSPDVTPIITVIKLFVSYISQNQIQKLGTVRVAMEAFRGALAKVLKAYISVYKTDLSEDERAKVIDKSGLTHESILALSSTDVGTDGKKLRDLITVSDTITTVAGSKVSGNKVVNLNNLK